MDIQLDFAPVLNIKPSPLDMRDWPAEAIFPTGDAGLPEEFSWEDLMEPIKNQGSTSQCAAYSASDVQEVHDRREFAATDGVTGFTGAFSPDWFYAQKDDPTTRGMHGREVVRLMKNVGMLPMADARGRFKDDPLAYEVAARHQIKNYARVASIDVVKRAILRNGPVLLAVPVYTTKRPDIWRPAGLDKIVTGGHMMTFIGWKKDGMLVRNSWGPRWGDGGYGSFPWKDWGHQWEMWATVDETSELPAGKVDRERLGFWAWLRGLVGR